MSKRSKQQRSGIQILLTGLLVLQLSCPGYTEAENTGYPFLLYNHTYTLKRISPLVKALRTGDASLATETELWNEAKNAIRL